MFKILKVGGFVHFKWCLLVVEVLFVIPALKNDSEIDEIFSSVGNYIDLGFYRGTIQIQMIVTCLLIYNVVRW